MANPLSSNTTTSEASALTASLEAKLALLESTHAALHSELLSLRSQRTLSTDHPSTTSTPTPSASFASTIPDPPTPPSHSSLLDFTLSNSDILSAHSHTRLHRLSTIPTTFNVIDPSSQHKQLGVRFDTIANAHSQKPAYVFYDDSGAVLRHSVPAFVWADGDGGPRAIRARVLRWRRRKAAAEGLKKAAEGAKRVGDVTEEWWRRVEAVEWDLDVLALRIRWTNGVALEAKVTEKGVVERAVVRGRKGERLREAEKRVRGELGGLAGKIGWIGDSPGIEMR